MLMTLQLLLQQLSGAANLNVALYEHPARFPSLSHAGAHHDGFGSGASNDEARSAKQGSSADNVPRGRHSQEATLL